MTTSELLELYIFPNATFVECLNHQRVVTVTLNPQPLFQKGRDHVFQNDWCYGKC